MGNQNRPRSINDIMPMIGARFYTQLDSGQLRSDVIQNEMGKVIILTLILLDMIMLYILYQVVSDFPCRISVISMCLQVECF